MKRNGVVSSSFRDPAGFVFFRDGSLYRQINPSYRKDYDLLLGSGLYQTLVDQGLLIPHREVERERAQAEAAYKVIQPEAIPFVSYPYEWSFSQLKDAALATLRIQRTALGFGMSLKDSSAYNIQFRDGRPVLIDTLSFEEYREGRPWVAYRQFCQHFLAPLALMSYRDIRLNQLSRVCLEGVPLDLVSSLLPWRTRWRLSLLMHIHLHARSQGYFSRRQQATNRYALSRSRLLTLVGHLESAVRGVKWRPKDAAWADYYGTTNYTPEALEHKKQIVSDLLGEIQPTPRMLWDWGANTGLFSRLASGRGIQTIALDMDPACVEENYLQCMREGETRLLPLVMDVTNPSPSLGWDNEERLSLLDRGPADVVLALALVHHLAIANNLPLGMVANSLARICQWLVVEFVPKSDTQVQRLLSTREDIFPAYTQEAFEREFQEFFAIRKVVPIRDTQRVVYLMQKT